MWPFKLSENRRHTWFIDLDGTIFEWEALFTKGEDFLLPGAKDFLDSIPYDDCVIFTTARKEGTREATVASLRRFGIKYDHIIFGIGTGERIVVNDTKIEPDGRELITAIAWPVERNKGFVHNNRDM